MEKRSRPRKEDTDTASEAPRNAKRRKKPDPVGNQPPRPVAQPNRTETPRPYEPSRLIRGFPLTDDPEPHGIIDLSESPGRSAIPNPEGTSKPGGTSNPGGTSKPDPKSLPRHLGVHQPLTHQTTDINFKVSRLCFDTSLFEMPSVKNQSPAFALLDAFVERGGNFIHTDYSKRRAADYLADWMVERRNREKIVLSVGFSEGWSVATRHMRRDPLPGGENEVLYINSFFHIQLQKLRTHYIDIYIVPKWWDDDGSIQTQWLLRALTDLHLANKVRYTGVAHVPAYSVAATNAAARQAGLIPFSVYRGAWNC